MGVDYRAVIGVGRVFDGRGSEAQEWFFANFKGELTDAEREDLEEDFRDALDSTDREDLPQLVCLNAYSGEGYALVFEMGSSDDLNAFVAEVLKSGEAWQKNFGETPSFLNETSVY